MSIDGQVPVPAATLAGLDGHADARNVVRLIQCAQCSYPLKEPMTLPCGYSLCRRCMPAIYKRENITYPSLPGRSEGFVCPFSDCGLEHSLGDCGVDVVLSKIMETISGEMVRLKELRSDTPLLLDERLNWEHIIDSSVDVMPRSRVLHGGRLVATYTLAEMGELNYHSDVSYTPVTPEGSTFAALDQDLFGSLKDICQGELDCQICYGLVLDPLTTSCGHTFCRKCIARVLDHSRLCPSCRRLLPTGPGAATEPTNKAISSLLEGLVPEMVALRIEIAAQEEAELGREGQISIFPVTLAYPHMPTFLHIFEPRYRLMIRRAVESGQGRFGVVMYNRRGDPQGSLGNSHFKQYGTLLQIQSLEMLPDGRSLIETKGVSRFRILETGQLDGYIVGRVERVEDVSLNDEENTEAQETSLAVTQTDSNEPPPLASLSTQQLLQLGHDFINQGRAASESWLQERVLAAYGQPPTDAAVFPYWFACVLPISEEEKYQLLKITSVRERLKLTVSWIRRIEAQRW